MQAAKMFTGNDVMDMPDRRLAVQRAAERAEDQRLLRIEEHHIERFCALGDHAHLTPDAGQGGKRPELHAVFLDALNARVGLDRYLHPFGMKTVTKRTVGEKKYFALLGASNGKRQQANFSAAELTTLIDEKNPGFALN